MIAINAVATNAPTTPTATAERILSWRSPSCLASLLKPGEGLALTPAACVSDREIQRKRPHSRRGRLVLHLACRSRLED